MRGAAEDANLTEWQRLVALVADNRIRGEIAALAKVFADLAGTAERWKAALLELDMQVSPTVEGWKREGALESTRQDLLQAIAVRFKTTAPPEVILKIQESTDLNTLKSWFGASLTANSLDLFRAATGL